MDVAGGLATAEHTAERVPTAGAPTADARHLGTASDEAWRRLGAATDLREFAEAWLALSAAQLPGARRAALFVAGEGEGGPYAPLARWSDGRGAATAGFVAETARLLEAVVERGSAAVARRDEATFLAVPGTDDASAPILVAETETLSKAATRDALRVAGWCLRVLAGERQRRAEREGEAVGDRARFVLDVLSAVTERTGHRAAARALADALAHRFGARRVSIGRYANGRAKIVAMSQTASFMPAMALARRIARAQEEAIDQARPLAHPVPEGATHGTPLLHAALSDERGEPVATVPMAAHGRMLGAVTLEGATLGADDAVLIDLVGAAVAPALESKREAERGALGRLAATGKRVAAKLLGPGALGWKLGAIAALLLTVALAIPVERSLRSDAVIEGSVRRAVTAPSEGFLASEHARAGQVVAAGDLLVAMDRSDLELERLRAVVERRQLELELATAVAERRVADVNVARSRIEQKDAEIDLLERRLSRAEIVAPFDAIVVEGDLSQRVGAPLSRGEVLLELAPLDEFRVTLLVPERQVREVEVGAAGTLLLAAMPDMPLPFEVESVTAITRAIEGENAFEVTARVTDAVDAAVLRDAEGARLLPGLQGVARLPVGDAPLARILFEPIVEWVRLKLWAYWP